MILWVMLVFSIFTKGFVCATELLENPSCSFGNAWSECSHLKPSHLIVRRQIRDGNRYIGDLRHLFGVGNNNNRRSSQGTLTSRVLNHLSLQNRHKLESHKAALSRIFQPLLISPFKPKYNHLKTMNYAPVDLRNVISTKTIKEPFSNNSSAALRSHTESITVINDLVTSAQEDVYVDKYPDITTNELSDISSTTESGSKNYARALFHSSEFHPRSLNETNNIVNELPQDKKIFYKFLPALDNFERKFYVETFEKLRNISPANRHENGISFVQSGLFLYLFLMALSTMTDNDTANEINACLGFNMTETEKTELVNEILFGLPVSSNSMKLRWSSRLVLSSAQKVNEKFRNDTASALSVIFDKFNGTESPDELASTLNHMVEKDSGGAIRDAFEVDEMLEGVRGVALTTLYLRAGWRSAATVLNGTRPFRDVDGTPLRTVRMIRINDVMRYANFEAWQFHAIEIPYSTPDLSLLMLVPYTSSLRSLVQTLVSTSLDEIYKQMVTRRIAVSMPIYTLRMTLLLPSKLQAMGVKRLVNWNDTENDELRLSHAVQRLMFWAEAGRNAFKDDGLEWDEAPSMQLMIDRPYVFFVRWKNMTLMNGNFVL